MKKKDVSELRVAALTDLLSLSKLVERNIDSSITLLAELNHIANCGVSFTRKAVERPHVSHPFRSHLLHHITPASRTYGHL